MIFLYVTYKKFLSKNFIFEYSNGTSEGRTQICKVTLTVLSSVKIHVYGHVLLNDRPIEAYLQCRHYSIFFNSEISGCFD
jgi:hypothetical protein